MLDGAISGAPSTGSGAWLIRVSCYFLSDYIGYRLEGVQTQTQMMTFVIFVPLNATNARCNFGPVKLQFNLDQAVLTGSMMMKVEPPAGACW